MMNLGVRKKGKVNILDISGSLTLGQGDELLREKVRELLAGGERLLIINMTGVPYMDSGGIAETVACQVRVSNCNGTMKLVLSEGAKIREILRVTGLTGMFEIFSDEEEALASFISWAN